MDIYYSNLQLWEQWFLLQSEVSRGGSWEGKKDKVQKQRHIRTCGYG